MSQYGAVIQNQIKRTSRNLIAANIVLLLLEFAYFGIGGLVVTNSMPAAPTRPTPQPAATGPVDTSHPKLITPKDVESEGSLNRLNGHAVEYKDSSIVDLKFPVWNLSQRGSHSRPDHLQTYHLSAVNGKQLVVIPDDNNPGPTYRGVVRPPDDQDRNTVSTVLGSRGVQKITLLPYVVDCLPEAFDQSPAQFAVPAATIHLPNMLFILLAAFPVWNIVRGIVRLKDPSTHPVVRRLASYGAVDEMCRHIDADWAAGVVTEMPAKLTQYWLIVPTFFTCIVVPLDEIVWIYQRTYVTKGRSFAIVVRDRRGRYEEFTCGMFQVNKIISRVTNTRPWIMSGYTGKLAVQFSSNRAQFIADVDARQRQYLSGPGHQPPPYAP